MSTHLSECWTINIILWIERDQIHKPLKLDVTNMLDEVVQVKTCYFGAKFKNGTNKTQICCMGDLVVQFKSLIIKWWLICEIFKYVAGVALIVEMQRNVRLNSTSHTCLVNFENYIFF